MTDKHPTRRDLLATISASSAVAVSGCVGSAILGCDDGELTVEEAKEKHAEEEEEEFDPTNPTLDEMYCVGGEVASIDYSRDVFIVEDSTGGALVSPMSDHTPSNRPDLEEGDCINVCGTQGGITGETDEYDIYLTSAQWND